MPVADRANVRLDSKSYPLAGAIARTARSSQRGDPGDLLMAEWRIDGPDFNSFEDIPLGGAAGYLGRDYGVNTDGRAYGVDVLGPKVTSIDLSVYDQTWEASILSTETAIASVNLIFGPPGVVDDAIGMAVINGPGPTPYGYIPRGTQTAKVDLTDMTVKRTGEIHAAPATDIIATHAPDATREVSVALGDEPYRVLTAVAAPPNSDTWMTNDESQAATIFGNGVDRIVEMNGNTVKGNILTSGDSMAAPAWAEVTSFDTERPAFTGFALDGPLWVLGTSNGPYMLDKQTGIFFPVIEEIDEHPDNCRGMTTWFPLGIVIPLHDSLRYQRALSGESFGPEVFETNTSPVQGHAHTFTASAKWGYCAFHNPSTNDSYLAACRPRQAGDAHSHPVSWFTIAKLTGVHCEFLRFVGTVNGLRTNPTLVGGYGSNAFWLTVGRTIREYEDTNYQHALSGQTYLTELRRQPGIVKDLEACEFTTANASANRTVTAKFSIDGDGDYANQALTAGTADGHQRQAFASSNVPLAWATGRRIKPRLDYATNDAAESPRVEGTFRLYYRIRPTMVNVYSVPLALKATSVREAEKQAQDLIDDWGSGPVATDLDGAEYVRVDDVKVAERADRGGGSDRTSGRQYVATVTCTEWTVA